MDDALYDNPLQELEEDVYDQWEWSDWEEDFIASVRGKRWDSLSVKQKNKITELVRKVRDHMSK